MYFRLLLIVSSLLFAAGFGNNGKTIPPALLSPTQKRPSIEVQTIYSDSASFIIPFNRVGNLMVVQATVDTVRGNFILDTGAPYLVLNLTYFRDYPITASHDAEQTSVGGRTATVNKTSVKQLSFGNMEFHRLEADLSYLGNIENAKGIKVLGLLGLELFKDCEMIIDFDKNLIHLHRIGRKESSTYRHEMLADTAAYRTYPIEITNSRLTTTTEVAGKKLKLVIDCAAESNILDSRLPNKIFENIAITRRVKLTGPGDKKVDALFGNLNTMKMGTQLINDLPVAILNLEYTCFADDVCVHGVLGFDFLSQHKLGFNFVKRKMYIWK
jgi:hypothetical protein